MNPDSSPSAADFESRRKEILLDQPVLKENLTPLEFQWVGYFFSSKSGADIPLRLQEIYNARDEKDKVFLANHLKEILEHLIELAITASVDTIYHDDKTMLKQVRAWEDDADVFLVLSEFALAFANKDTKATSELKPQVYALIQRKKQLAAEAQGSEEQMLALVTFVQNLPDDFDFKGYDERLINLNRFAQKLNKRQLKEALREAYLELPNTPNKQARQKIINKVRRYLLVS